MSLTTQSASTSPRITRLFDPHRRGNYYHDTIALGVALDVADAIGVAVDQPTTSAVSQEGLGLARDPREGPTAATGGLVTSVALVGKEWLLGQPGTSGGPCG